MTRIVMICLTTPKISKILLRASRRFYESVDSQEVEFVIQPHWEVDHGRMSI
jgi:hypothetical protein